MFNRRQFARILPASALAVTVAGARDATCAEEPLPQRELGDNVLASPPVIQNPRARGFDVVIAVNGLATAWVEYGFSDNDLPFTALASHHGLIQADDRVLHVRLEHQDPFPDQQPIFYRVLVQPLRYLDAYRLERGEPQATRTYRLRLPSPAASRTRVVAINDTHENLPTIQALHQQIAQLDPDLLIWNGDTCNDFDQADSPEQIVLNPAGDGVSGWASTRPLVFSNGNHDVRGVRARELQKSFISCPESSDLPYNQAIRIGPLALVTLDTGEDKPDHHPVFAGTACYQPYRQRQATWLRQVVRQPEISTAALKIATTHIPLRGLEGQNDGTTLEGYARFSGFGARLWLPILQQAGFQAVLSGHTHRHRVDQPEPTAPIHQFVGGGPQPMQATLTIVDANQSDDRTEMTIRVVDLSGEICHEHSWSV